MPQLVDTQDPLPHQLRENRGRYSLGRAIRQAANAQRLDGIEAEVSQELARRTGRSPTGFLVPWDVECRALDKGTGIGGVPVILGTLVDVLRAKLATAKLGAQTLPDLRGGEFALPKKTATVSLGWCAEGTAPSESEPVVGQQVLFSPRTIGAYTDVTVRAMALVPSADALVANDLILAIANEIDRVALNGNGNAFQPLGLLQNPAIAEVAIGTNGGAPTLAVLAAMEQTVGNANADAGTLGWATTPNARYKLRTTQKASGTSSFLWDDGQPGPLGHPAIATNQIPSNLTKGSSGAVCSAMTFGNWSDLIIGLWGPVDILVDPFKFSTTGVVRIRGLQDVDVNVRHFESFVHCVDMTTT